MQEERSKKVYTKSSGKNLTHVSIDPSLRPSGGRDQGRQIFANLPTLNTTFR